jgi:glycosyltransferase involved in cell wall biosynthesis
MVRGDSHLNTPRRAIKRTLKYPVYRALIPRFDACLAAGVWSREYYLHYGARPERVFSVPHAVDAPAWALGASESARRRAELRARWSLDATATVFLFVGKFTDVKQPADFVRAVALAARSGRVAGLMVGDGPLRHECERLAGEVDAPVRFAGFLNQSEIAGAYAAADVLVVPSSAETWALVVNEAMTCGLPCVVSDRVGCGPDLVVPGETGYIYPFGDVAALAAAIGRLSGDAERIASMGRAARARVEGYSVGAAVEGVLSALDYTCSGATRGSNGRH